MPDQEQPEVVLADPQRLQALRRALEERAVLTYCTDGATLATSDPSRPGDHPAGGGGRGPADRGQLDMDLTDEAGASKVSQLTTPLRLLEGTVLGRPEGDGLARTTHRDIRRRARQARAVATELRWEALRCED